MGYSSPGRADSQGKSFFCPRRQDLILAALFVEKCGQALLYQCSVNFLYCYMLITSIYDQDFRIWNDAHLKKLHCQISDPIPLGEGAGVGLMKGVDSMTMPEGSTLFDLVQTGVDHTHAAVGVVVRLRKELSLVKDIPVLFAIDQVRYILVCVRCFHFDIVFLAICNVFSILFQYVPVQ